MKNDRGFDIFEKVSSDHAMDRQNAEARLNRCLIAILVSSAISLAMFFLISNFSDEIVCAFSNKNALLYLWPPNGYIIDSISTSRYTYREKCEFIAARSIMSATLLPYLAIITFTGIRSANSYYVRGWIFPFFVLLMLGVLTEFIPISESDSRFNLTYSSDIKGNIIKSAISIFGIYSCIYIICFRLFPYIRSLHNMGKGNS